MPVFSRFAEDETMNSGVAINREAPTARVIFLSYRSIDDEPPPEDPNGGFVSHLRSQLRWELNQLGVPDAVLWMDRYKLQLGDTWSEKIREELNKADLFIALLSRNYVKSDWCATELSTMAARVAALDKDAKQRRIFRADKHRVADENIHDALKGIQAIRFFDDDKELNREDEFFYRGQVRCPSKYYDAVHKLAESIHQRLEELGVEMGPQAHPLTFSTPQNNGRAVFVAKPARDMNSEYLTLTAELVRSGYRVLPDPAEDLPDTAEEAQATIVSCLAESELSIHLLGERTGIRPDGLEADIVPFQLSCAASEAGRRPSFYRLIWAPKVLAIAIGDNPEFAPRDPFKVLSRFGAKLESDQIDSDTATRFNEFVFQRLENKSGKTSKTIYVHCGHGDRLLALEVSKALRKAGYSPIIRPDPTEGSPEERESAERALIHKAQRAILCWGNATQAALVSELTGSTIAKWREEDPAKRSIVLLIGPPSTAAKAEVIELGLGEDINTIVDGSSQTAPGSDVGATLIPKMD
jgi:hypothetical protein